MRFKQGSVIPPPSDAKASWFDKSYRVQLPEDYLAFLQTGNGGIPIEKSFLQNGRERMIEFFLCLLDSPADDENGWRDITVVHTQIGDRLSDDPDLVGTKIVPIASLFAGDFVCLDFRRDPLHPVVVVWDHEISDVDAPHCDVVAKSFSDFASSLTE